MTNLACSLFCQGATRFGGEGWVGSHGVVGAGSYWVTSPREGVRVTPQHITPQQHTQPGMGGGIRSDD